MKKKHCREIKLLAEKLPPSFQKVVITKGTMIKDLPKEERDSLAERDGVSPLGSNVYLQKGIDYIQINHYKRMKKAYARNKEQGLMDYIKWVNANNKRINQEVKDANLEEVNENIMKLTEGPANKFWIRLRGLINFLMSFMSVFQNKEEHELS